MDLNVQKFKDFLTQHLDSSQYMFPAVYLIHHYVVSALSASMCYALCYVLCCVVLCCCWSKSVWICDWLTHFPGQHWLPSYPQDRQLGLLCYRHQTHSERESREKSPDNIISHISLIIILNNISSIFYLQNIRTSKCPIIISLSST